ncbi:MAG: UDP-N-acetylmuramate--L-alanine ligase [Candidatus Velamenicoccus archaeovorus]
MSDERSVRGGSPAPPEPATAVGQELFVPPPGSIPTLEVPDLGPIRSAHLIGIGGYGMRTLARMLLARGIRVTGSDLKDRGVAELRAMGATVHVGHRPEQIGEPDAVVVSSAVQERNVELAEARRRGLRVLARAQVLAALATGHRTLAVSGTHGKTTTTSMLSTILEREGLDPSFVIGGDLNEIGSGAKHGGGDLFVVEVDESDGSFLLFRPAVAIVTNIEADHHAFYEAGRPQIEGAFARFATQAERLVVCADDAGATTALRRSGREAVTYGRSETADVRLSVRSATEGSVRLEDGRTVELRLRVPGVHNQLDALAAILAAREVGVPPERATRALDDFVGVKRRLEHRGSARGADLYDDYAHHPTEVVTTLAAAPRAGHERLLVVFQPHRYTRTRALWRQLGESLAGVDLAVVTDVYHADEDPIPGITGKLVANALAEAATPGQRVAYLPHRAEVVRFLTREIRPGDLVLMMGAGDIPMITDEVLERLEERA